MQPKFFVLKLIPPRISFIQDMSSEERAIMQQHAAYWSKLMSQGKVLVYGPVLDPREPYGLGIVKLEDEKELEELMGGDPANGLNRYEWSPMMAVIPPGKQ